MPHNSIDLRDFSFQVRAQALFSGAERPLGSETLEYAWLVELQAGDITGRLTVPQVRASFFV